MGRGGRSKDSPETGRVPSPLQYHPNDALLRQTSPMWRISKSSSRQSLRPDVTAPGPAAYNLPTTMGSGPKVLLHGKRTVEKVEMVPGPGDYSPNHKVTLEGYPRVALSTAPRVGKDYGTKKDIPGPGQYALNTTLKGPMFG